MTEHVTKLAAAALEEQLPVARLPADLPTYLPAPTRRPNDLLPTYFPRISIQSYVARATLLGARVRPRDEGKGLPLGG